MWGQPANTGTGGWGQPANQGKQEDTKGNQAGWGQPGSNQGWGQPSQPGQQGQGWGQPVLPVQPVVPVQPGQQAQQGQGWGQGGQGQGFIGQGAQGSGAHFWNPAAEKTFQINSTVSEIDLHGVIPENAVEVKLFIEALSGYSEADINNLVTFTTDHDKIKFRVRNYKQDAWSFNSENTSLQLQEKKIHVKFEGNLPLSFLQNKTHGSFSLTVLAWR